MVGYYAKRSHSEQFQKLTHPISKDMWINAPSASDAQLKELIDTYNLNASIVYDVKDKQELSRVEFSGDATYVFVRMPTFMTNGRIASHPVLCIIQQPNFFTISSKNTLDPNTVAEYAIVKSTRHGMDMLLGVIAGCVAEYEVALKHTERSIDGTGARLRNREITNQDFVHFVVVEDNLTACRMNLSGIAAALKRLKDTTKEPVTSDHLEMLDDILLQVQQLLVAVESHGGRVNSIRNAYSTIANNTLNQRMKTLTVFTVMIALPNLFYGMYGMNVTGLPFHDMWWGYLFVLVMSLGVTAILFGIAKLFKIF